jgi:hypothetical protein
MSVRFWPEAHTILFYFSYFSARIIPMTPEERSLLERTAALTEENNAILHKMRRSSRWQLVFQIFYWVLILGLTFGAFYFIQPYINSLTGALGDLDGSSSQSGADTGQGQSFVHQLQQALKQL